jgi:hypothetical protein
MHFWWDITDSNSNDLSGTGSLAVGNILFLAV